MIDDLLRLIIASDVSFYAGQMCAGYVMRMYPVSGCEDILSGSARQPRSPAENAEASEDASRAVAVMWSNSEWWEGRSVSLSLIGA